MFKSALQVLFTLGLTLCAHASVLYSFTYTASSVPFPSTTFQLIEPGFLTAGTYSVAPFSMSDGSVTYDFTRLFINPFGTNFCFVFGTANVNGFGGCGASMSAGAEPVASVIAEFAGTDGNPPSVPGAFSGSGIVNAFPPFATSLEQGIGSFELDVTLAPEPSAAHLVGVFLFAGVTATILRKHRRSI